MKLYHNPVSTCSQKVRLVLAGKGLDYSSQLLDLLAGDQFAPEYVAKNPNAVVPTLEDGDRVFIESTLINEYLEDAYPEPAMAPQDAAGRHAMRLWTKKIDELHPLCGIQTFAIGARPGMLARPKEEVDALIQAIPDPGRRAVRRSVIDHGVQAPEFVGAYQGHEKFFDLADQTLTGSPYLVGETFSLADAALLPYVLRVDHLNLHGLLEGRAGLAAWYERVQSLLLYEAAVSSFLPEPMVAAFRTAGEAVADDVRRAVGGS